MNAAEGSRMNWAWASSLDHLWRSPSFPMWLTLAAAGFFGIIVLITLLRAEKSVANGVLTVITLLAIGAAAATTLRGFGPGRAGSAERPSSPAMTASLPALSCVDDLAGDTVLMACEKVLFGSADSTAAAISYAASQITRLAAAGDVATANRNLTPELEALRRAVERDRYGLMAYVLVGARSLHGGGMPGIPFARDNRQIISNMDDRFYEGLVVRYSGSWNAPPVAATASLPGIVAALPPGMPTGKPTNAEFPSAASTPPVNIMTPEPGTPPAAARGGRAPRRRAAARHRVRGADDHARRGPGRGQEAAPAPKSARAPTQIAPSSPPLSTGSRRRQRMIAFKSRYRPLLSGTCHFISSSLPSAATRSRNSRAGLPNGWRPPRKKACRSVTSTSPG